jgi:hypothetical protein
MYAIVDWKKKRYEKTISNPWNLCPDFESLLLNPEKVT